MKTRFITSIFIVIVTALAVASKLLSQNIGEYIFDIFIILLTLVASFQVCNLMEKSNRKVNKIFTVFYAIFNYVIALLYFDKVDFSMIIVIEFIALILYFALVFIVETIINNKNTSKENGKTAFNTILACIYPAFLFMLLVCVNHIDSYAGVRYFSLMFIVLVFAITWLTDTMAYLVGRTFKGPKLAPSISPNKTISGAIGGLLGGIGGAMLVFLLMTQIPELSAILNMHSLAWWHFMLLGAVCSVAGQSGDLFESKLKRRANVKDSGAIFPGHGGMLDRIDAMIFVTVVIFLAVSLILL